MNEIVVSSKLFVVQRTSTSQPRFSFPVAGQLAPTRPTTPRIDEFPVLSVSRGSPRDRRNLQSHSNTYRDYHLLLCRGGTSETRDNSRGFARYCFSRIEVPRVRTENGILANEISCTLSSRETYVDFFSICLHSFEASIQRST